MTIAMPSRPSEPVAGLERTQLEGWLDYHRATLLAKCAGLSFEQLTLASAPPSDLTLMGLLQHMTQVEIQWFDVVLYDSATAYPYASDDDPDAEFHDFSFASPEEVAARFLEVCARSRDLAAPLALDSLVKQARRDGAIDLRWVYLHMIEEYARHNGHADLLRERIDGATGL